MTSSAELEITVYYDREDAALVALVRELDDLAVPYDECRFEDATEEVRARLTEASDGSFLSPSVVINGDILARPTSANVMSAIMHARSAGFYQ